MANLVSSAYDAMNKLNLWFKISNSEPLMLTDIPEILKYRWAYFRDNWSFLQQRYVDAIDTYVNPDQLRNHILALDEFITIQRNVTATANPFATTNVLYEYYAVFDTTSLTDINLTATELSIVSATTASVQNMTRSDFEQLRNRIAEARDYIADIIGLTDADYNGIYDRSAFAQQVNPTNANLNLMAEYLSAIQSVDFILANTFSLQSVFVDPFALAKQNANNPEIDIATYNSGSLTRLRYNETLQELAARTLGSADQWIEIAIANGLKPPYLDEVGEAIPLISNASGNQLNIAGTDNAGNLNIDKIFVHQILVLQSSTQPFSDQRTIINIKQAPVSGEIIIELDGESDLGRYTLANGAYLRVFKPNTTNSSQFILIPSLERLSADRKSDIPWFLQGSSNSERRQQVDLFTDENGELGINSTGDLMLSYGMANAVQAIKLKLQTEVGELSRHLDFGLIQLQGQKNNDITSIKAALVESINTNMQADDRFERLERLDVQYGSGVINVTMSVRIAGSGQLLPITFSIPLS
jgi:hypothetical protein